ncbi:unnamed protein product [Mytilus coruscus]|uniref:DDE Tnp4 domain-containing protein n=1 Tax=Mytilus coruscus TaxID=42192 RepID=A0A6J8C8R3_MYTCO|nr:unnamed protein product [Mytilus coruscus]
MHVEDRVKKDTYICSKHFVGGRGPTDSDPDLIPATTTPSDVHKLGKRRKPPTPRNVSEKHKKTRKCLCITVNPPTNTETTQTETHIGLDLEVRIENSVLKNQNVLLQSEIELLRCTLNEQEGSALGKTSENETVVKYINMYLDVNNVKEDPAKFKFYTGLTVPQFMCLLGYLGPSVNKLVYWNNDCDVPDRSPKKRPGPKQKMTPMNKLFMTLIRIRQGLLLEDLSYRFGVSKTTVSRVVLTWIQFLYIRLSALRTKMFPDRSKIRKHLPKSFKKYKNIRCIIDCTEVFVQQSRNFGKQGNSSYKGHTTYKFLVGIAPNGTIVYISDAFEGSISDKEIVKKSGFLNTLNNGDEITADRGFSIDDLLMSREAKLIIPPFLGSRDKFTPQEEASTKDIAKHLIHVERAIERMKKYRILQKLVPLSLQPVFSQMIFVIAYLVNFQEPLVQ